MATTTATKKKSTTDDKPNSRPRFTTSYVGTTPAGPFAFQVEGNLTKPAELQQLSDGRAVLNNSIGIGRSAFAMFAAAEGTYDKDAEYPDNNFIDLTAFGEIAERMAKLPKGSRIVVAGKMSKRTWSDKAGAEHENIQILVSEFASLACKANAKGADAATTIPATNQYKRKTGELGHAPVACLVSGNIFSVDELTTSPSGTPLIHFSVFAQEPAAKVLDKARGVDVSGKEYDPKHTLIRCSVFGKQAEGLAKLLKKGMRVVVSGRIAENVYEGKSSVQMVVSGLNVINPEPATGSSAVIPLPEDAGEAPVGGAAAATGEVDSAFFQGEDDDDDSGLPF